MTRTEIQRRYRESHREKLREWGRIYREQNRNEIRTRNRKRYSENPNKQKIAGLKYRANHKQKCLDYQNRYRKRKRVVDPNFRITDNLRSRVHVALRGIARSQTTIQLLGCSIEDLWIYLESQFQEGMTRDNYGLIWEVDHIIPCAIFDLTKHDHQKRCFHFSNLQPLFRSDNRRKSDKIQ